MMHDASCARVLAVLGGPKVLATPTTKATKAVQEPAVAQAVAVFLCA